MSCKSFRSKGSIVMEDFGIGGRCVTVHPGPVITMYEFEPASGVKVNRIVSLADDLALALRALSVRIIAPLPGLRGLEDPPAVALLSTDLDEVLRLSDRIFVMVRGKLKPVPEEQRTHEGVGELMLSGRESS